MLRAVSLQLAFLVLTISLVYPILTLELLERLVDLIKLTFVELEDPVASTLDILSFPDQWRGQLFRKTIREGSWQFFPLSAVSGNVPCMIRSRDDTRYPVASTPERLPSF